MKKLIGKILLFSLLPLFLLLGINYKYDPANLFDSTNEYEHKIADYLLQGYNVTNISNMDERKLQEFFIAGMEIGPEIIILGSSNSLYIDSDFFPGKRVINNAVSSATFNDFIAIYNLYEKKGFKPDKVIMGICPEMLNSNQNKFFSSIVDNYNSMLSKIGLKNINISTINKDLTFTTWLEIFSLSYFQESVYRMFNNNAIKPTKEIYNKGASRIIDGSLNNGEFYFRKSPEDIESSIKRLIGKPAAELEDFSSTNPVQKEILEHFVDYLQEQNIEVVFYLMVYYPDYYEYVSKKYPVLTEIENYLIGLANERCIKFYGQNNPGKCNVTKADFTDYCHLFKTGLLKIFK